MVKCLNLGINILTGILVQCLNLFRDKKMNEEFSQTYYSCIHYSKQLQTLLQSIARVRTKQHGLLHLDKIIRFR
jgi:hypothetical protein